MKEKTHQNNIEKKKLSRESREQFFFFYFLPQVKVILDLT